MLCDNLGLVMLTVKYESYKESLAFDLVKESLGWNIKSFKHTNLKRTNHTINTQGSIGYAPFRGRGILGSG